MNFMSVLHLAAIIHGIILGLVLIILKREKRANIYIGSMVLLFSISLIEDYILMNGLIQDYPFMLGVSASFPLFYGPLFYLYADSLITHDNSLKPKKMLHFVPGVLLLLYLFIRFYFHSLEYKYAFAPTGSVHEMIRRYALIISGASYSIVTFLKVSDYQKKNM